MEELDHDWRQHQQGGDENLAVRFFIAPMENAEKSLEAGRPIFDDTEMIEIRVRGDRNNIVNRPVRPEDKKRFRDQWRAYNDDRQEAESGTPLSQWPAASASFVEEMKYLGFRTVEHIASANDAVCSNVVGLTLMRERARSFLEFAKGNAPTDQLNAKVAELTSQLEAERANKADLAKRLEDAEQRINRLAARMADAPAGDEPAARTAAAKRG